MTFSWFISGQAPDEQNIGLQCWSIWETHMLKLFPHIVPATSLKLFSCWNTNTVWVYELYTTSAFDSLLVQTNIQVKLSSSLCVCPCPAWIQHTVTIIISIHMGHTHTTTNCSCQYTSGNCDDAGSIEPMLSFQSIMMKHSHPRKCGRWWWREATTGRLRLQAEQHINPAVKLYERGGSVTSKCWQGSFSYSIIPLNQSE